MSSVSTAFDLLHPGVQRQLWRMGWRELKPLQVRSIQHLMQSEGHAVLSAGTAAGKTEAAFLPILSMIADEPTGSVRAMYIGPLKALINDQFGRLEELCNYLEMPVHRWHGDVGAAAKKKLVKEPGGVLLITPESLESLFVNRSNSLPSLFGGLRFVVIDELHAFLGNERGLHLRSLLYRVAKLCERPLRMVGLSATIGEPRVALEYLDREQPDQVAILTGDAAEPEIRLKVHFYPDARSGAEPSVAAHAATASAGADEDQVELHDHERQLATDLVRHCQGNVNLVFANSRDDVELFGDACSRIATDTGVVDPFMVHHGSLSADLRHDAETTMKETSSRGGSAATTFCTSTLEMGIDIGGVAMVGQIGAPSSVASLKQRLGRSGRRAGAARVLRMYLRARTPDEHSDLFDRLHLGLVQAVAVIELLLERWVEPAVHRTCDLSTLTQQIISLIAEQGGADAQRAYDVLIRNGVFRDVDRPLFVQLLRQLGAKDVVEQTSQGELILGLLGETIRKDKSFYAAFASDEALTVLHESRRIGTIDAPPRVGDHLILARRRWRAVDVDEENLVVYVVPAQGFKRSPFGGAGNIMLHPVVVARMRHVLTASRMQPSFLDSSGVQLLKDARAVANAAGLATAKLVELAPSKTAIMTWAGGRTQRSLAAVLSSREVVAADETIALVVELPSGLVREHLSAIATSAHDPLRVARHLITGPGDKYDYLLNDALREARRVRRDLDLAGAVDLAGSLSAAPS